MATMPVLHVTVRFPDLSPDDLDTLHEAVEALPPWKSSDLGDRLLDLADRCGRMLLTSECRYGDER